MNDRINRFIGDTQIPSFDGNFKIDIGNYRETQMPEYEGFEFQYISTLDISEYTTKSEFYEELEQKEIRYDDRDEEAKQEMQDSYTRNDWLIEEGPPPQWMVGNDGKIEASNIINGRRRVRGAIEFESATSIPIAVYKPKEELTDDLEVYQYRLESAEIANDLKSSRRYNQKMDYIMLGVHFIKKGIIGGDTASVLAWLEDRMNYKERFLAANTQTEILNKIIEWGTADYELTENMTTPIADAWVVDNDYKVKDPNGHYDKNLFVVCVDNVRYADRLMADAIIPACLKIQRTDPVRIILYSKKRKPADIKKNTKTFVNAIENAYQNCFNLVRVMMPVLDPFIEGNVPEYRPWIIEGCIPQIVGEQDVDGGKLIPYEEVIADLDTSKKKKKNKVSSAIDKSLGVAA